MKRNDFWLEKFKKEALPLIYKEYAPDTVLMFGSRVRGDADDESDIDIIVVSDFFKDIAFIKRIPLLLKKLRFPKHIDALCYSKEEFARIKTGSAVVMDALEHGEVVDKPITT
jgi:predicted nucleotidyltransferase